MISSRILPILLKPDASRVVIRPFVPVEDEPEFATAGRTRAQRIADRMLALNPAAVADQRASIVASLCDHHRDVDQLLRLWFHDINGLCIAASTVSSMRCSPQ